MKKFGGRRSTVLTVIAAAVVIAVATTGGAVAGGLVTSAKIKNNTIKSVDVKNNNLKGLDIRDGSLTGADVTDNSLTGSDVANGSLTQGDFSSAPAGLVRGYAFSGTAAPTEDVPAQLTSGYNFNSAGGVITRVRTDVGQYSVTFAGLDLSAGNVQVSAYGADGTWCNSNGWGGSTADVVCYDDAGVPANSRFTVAFIR